MISLKNISKSFGDNLVLDNFSIDIQNITAIRASSGAGKTTLINIILGFEEADSGHIVNLPEDIAVVFQENRLIEHITALENLLLVNKNVDECKEMLEILGIQSIDEICANLSGGMKRRIAIARAFLTKANFIILDEPFTGLDDENRKVVLAFIKKISSAKTILLITHNHEDIRYLDLNVFKNDGKFLGFV